MVTQFSFFTTKVSTCVKTEPATVLASAAAVREKSIRSQPIQPKTPFGDQILHLNPPHSWLHHSSQW